MMTYWADGVIITVRLLRELFPKVPVVLGGIAVQLLPEYFSVELPDVTLYEKRLPVHGETISFPGIDPILSAPEHFSLLNGFKRSQPHPHGPVLSSLGCPMRCTYCASARLQPTFVQRSPDSVLEELSLMVECLSIVDFAFYDDALLVNSEDLLVPLLHGIIERQWKIRLHTPNGLHIRYLTKPLLDLMKKAGFTTLRFGYESGIHKNRLMTDGKTDVLMMRVLLEQLREYHFPDVGIYLMGGLPGGTPEELADEMQAVALLGAKVKPVFLSPVPGTPLFEHYLKDFPELADNPHWQNDTFFITRLPGWGDEAVERIRILARKLNGSM